MSDSKKPLLVGNAADEEQVREAERVERWRDEDEKADIAAVLSTDAGRRFVWSILARCNIFRPVFGGTDNVWRMEGERAVGLWLLDRIEAVEPMLLVETLRQKYVSAAVNRRVADKR